MGKTFDMLLDNSAVSSWIGPDPTKSVEKIIQPSGSYMEGQCKELVQDDGQV